MTYKVLVVDDQKAYASLIVKALSTSMPTIAIYNAENGLEACQVAENERPNLILMDWEMPEMSGIDAIKTIKANPTIAHIPIIMVSSRPKQEYAPVAFEAGAHDFLQKPFNKKHLLRKIEKVLNVKMVA